MRAAPSQANGSTVKRACSTNIRRTARVRVAPCDARGAVAGEWLDGEARVLDETDMTRVNELLDRKYGAAMAQFKQRNNLQNVAWDAIEIRV